ncbi:MAG: outer membrane protein assembly factor [Gammaproteobacteria bacterium]|nr:MAG: outer membrane protein assembly factor [Gammaproteobacteria bacterium]
MMLSMSVFADEGLNVSVAISGIEGEELENVKVHLGYADFVSNPQRDISVRRWYKASKKRIKKSLEALGYYSVDIESDYLKSEEKVQISFIINLNEPVIVENVDVTIAGEGNSDLGFLTVTEKFNQLRGKKFRHDNYESLKSDLANIAVAKGYFDSQFTTRKVDVFPDKKSAMIMVKFDSGNRYLFGEVTFDKSRLSQKFLQAFIPFEYAEKYDAAKLIKLRSKLLSSQYFSSVNVVRGDKPADSLLWPITVNYQLKPRYKYDFGVGFGTDTGARISLGFEDRLLNSSGHHYSIFTVVSQKQQNAGFEYIYPLEDPLHDLYKFTISYEKEDIDFASTKAFVTGAERVRIKENDWTRSLFIRYMQEKSYIAERDVDASLLLPGISWVQSHSNDFKYPTKGWMGNINLMGGIESVGSDFSLLHARTRFKLIKSLFPGFRLLLRTELGGMHVEDEDYNNMPLSLRFFAGGDKSVRGYEYKYLSPELDGHKIGARYLVVGSAEVDYKVSQDWAVATFVDYGGAINKFTEPLDSGVGVGLRWFSPVGPVRFDLAFPQDNKADNFRIHFSIGPDL